MTQAPLCTDDFGTLVFRCRYTDGLVWANQALVVGATIPGVKARYVIADTSEARQQHRLSGISFHESEANCNTCAHLERVAHLKNAGLLYGRCASPEAVRQASPYFARAMGDVMVFHPDDYMGMPCYKSRWGIDRPSKEPG